MLSPGATVLWRHFPRGGYGYPLQVPGRFVGWGPMDKVRVELLKADGELIPKTIRDVNLTDAGGRKLSELRRMAMTA
jgi:hypothetical protein